MSTLFYISSIIAVLSTIMVITRYHPVHALLYLAVSFFSSSMVFLSLGAPFVAALEVIVYAGAIIVLFIFVVMMLNLGKETAQQEREWLKPKVWVLPAALVLLLLIEMIVLLFSNGEEVMKIAVVEPRKLALSLYGEYIIAVELTGFLLMAGIVGAAHIGKHKKEELHRFLQNGKSDNQKTKRTRKTNTVKNEQTAIHE
ncbi:NADH dehydrogenase subunit J [Niastella koreensis GR20-10]|uniref:NADH-quinone oxidoreductase subunit J n=2 Tax=Niastella koreensis TaxID=354356 RepID=G8TC00_NIAKG|nr:NADH-quinone oxidoreductase subunit J [Niastella koreensis]AEV99293.1 NADH dehydrogenase subunit J [Niastella koreensis GR20-10]